MATEMQKATLAGGCFWCLEAVFDKVKGVVSVESGYAGGDTPNPTYKQVCTGSTGHAEAVQITFDSQVISFRDLLFIFFTIHDPTTLNRQGNDVGTQYRSVVFYHDEEQQLTAREVIQEITQTGTWGSPIITEIVPLETFYVAEDYHQEYYANNPNQGYCRIVIAPKVKKFQMQYQELLK